MIRLYFQGSEFVLGSVSQSKVQFSQRRDPNNVVQLFALGTTDWSLSSSNQGLTVTPLALAFAEGRCLLLIEASVTAFQVSLGPLRPENARLTLSCWYYL